jgi:hypothetical protein
LALVFLGFCIPGLSVSHSSTAASSLSLCIGIPTLSASHTSVLASLTLQYLWYLASVLLSYLRTPIHDPALSLPPPASFHYTVPTPLSITTVWLPIALTCRIHHHTRYQDTYRQRTIIISSPILPYSSRHYTGLIITTLTRYRQTHSRIQALHRHYSLCSPRCITAGAALSHRMDANGLITRTRYQDTETTPSQRQALEHHTNPSFHYPRTPTASFWLYWMTAVSAELNTNDPDPTLILCLVGLYCTAFGYRPCPFNTIHSVIFPARYLDGQASLYS